jgi:hypothetical protein
MGPCCFSQLGHNTLHPAFYVLRFGKGRTGKGGVLRAETKKADHLLRSKWGEDGIIAIARAGAFGESLCAGRSEEPSGLVCRSPGAALRKRDRPITFLLALCFLTHSGFSLPWSREYPPFWANHTSRSASEAAYRVNSCFIAQT